MTHTHTHTHLFNGPLSELPGWADTWKVKKTIWILLKQETVTGSGISWAICKSEPRSRQITTPAPHHSVFYRPDALPAAQPTASATIWLKSDSKMQTYCRYVNTLNDRPRWRGPMAECPANSADLHHRNRRDSRWCCPHAWTTPARCSSTVPAPWPPTPRCLTHTKSNRVTPLVSSTSVYHTGNWWFHTTNRWHTSHGYEMNTHTPHTRFNSLFSGTTQASRYQKPRQHPTTEFFYRPDAPPAGQPAASMHWRPNEYDTKQDAILSCTQRLT